VELNERIRVWREYAGLTKTALANAVGVAMTAVIQWENGGTTPKSENLELIAEACGVSMEQFWGRLPKRKRSAS